MRKIGDRVINTILTLRDSISGPLKAVSKATELANSHLDGAKELVEKYEGTIANANKHIDSAKARITNLSKEYSSNSKHIEKLKSETEKYEKSIADAKDRAQEYGKGLENTKLKLKQLQSAQETTNKALEEANKSGEKSTLKKLTKEYSDVSKEIEKTKSEIERYTKSSKATEEQIESYNKRLETSKSQLHGLEKAQESNTKAVETARKVMVDYEKVITQNNGPLNTARAKMREYGKSFAEISKRAEEGKKKILEWGKAFVETGDDVVKRAIQATVAVATLVGGFAVKEGFGEAMNMEGYKMQLETATKSTQKAGLLMSNAIKFANSTPFETGEVVESTAKMEAYGISSKRWLKDVADMAGATNKSIDQATEAMADGVMGEFERLKEFGIKKEQLIEAAALKYGKNIVFNKRGQVKDEAKLQDILQAEMQKKFIDGAEKQAKTLKGLWSTVTGVTKSSLAKIVGMTEEGTIKQSSLYMKLKEQVERVVGVLNRWQKDGTIDKIAERVAKAVESMIIFFSELFNFIKKYRAVIETILIFISTLYLVTKAIAILKIALTTLSVVLGVLNGTIALSPIGLITIAIAGLVAICYLLWNYLDEVINMFKGVFSWIKKTLNSLGPLSFAFATLVGPIGWVITIVLGLIQHFDKLKKIVLSIPGILSELKKWILDSYDTFLKWITGLKETFLSLDKVKNAINFVKIAGQTLLEWINSIVSTFQIFYGWIKIILDSIGEFTFLLGGPIAPLLGLIQHFDKLKEAGEKAFNIINKVFGSNSKDTDISISENKNIKSKLEAVESLRLETASGVSGMNFPELKEISKSEPNFGQDKKYSQSKDTGKSNPTETKINVVIKGDVYGFNDFKEKVAEAVIKITNPNMSNMVR
ncbi:MAG: hypothetical protein ACRC0Y_08480 [Fusobacteriaceae bacterium]